METIGYLFAAISIVWFWADVLRIALFMKKTNNGLRYRNNLLMWIDRKPINCGVCLSGWLGIYLSWYGYGIYFLTLPLLYHIIIKRA